MSSYGTGKAAPALGVACPALDVRPNGIIWWCGAAIGERCVNHEGSRLQRIHPARRLAADAKRTAEVQAKIDAMPQDAFDKVFASKP
jgi:hypothetical protein